MKFPSSKHKRYLGGADWCLTALSQGTLATTGRQCVFQVAVFLEGQPEADRLGAAFADFCARFPLLWGAPARCWCLAPYWKYPAAADPSRPIHIGQQRLPADAGLPEIVRLIETLTNQQAAQTGWTTALEIVRRGDDDTVLLFSFDHCLFDAGGAETFINLFFRQLNGEADEAEFPAPRPTASAQLDQWGRKFKSGQKVNRLMRQLAQATTAHLPLPTDAADRPFRFRAFSITQAESQRLQKRAFAVAGYLMFTPYVLATAAAVFQPLFASQEDADFVVSVSTDKQKAATRTPHFFFNDLSFLYFRFPVAAVGDRQALAGNLREQLVNQARQGVPAAIEDANLLMRILPARTLWRFLMRFYRNRLASFGFTCLGESTMKTTTVANCRVRKLIHFPVIPTPPGVGLVLNHSDGAYHVVLSYLDGIVAETEADDLMATFRKQLLDEPEP